MLAHIMQLPFHDAHGRALSTLIGVDVDVGVVDARPGDTCKNDAVRYRMRVVGTDGSVFEVVAFWSPGEVRPFLKVLEWLLPLQGHRVGRVLHVLWSGQERSGKIIRIEGNAGILCAQRQGHNRQAQRAHVHCEKARCIPLFHPCWRL